MHSKHWYIVRMTVPEAVDTLHNGNCQDFATWVNKATKTQLLDAIEYHSGQYGSRHTIINYMRLYLKK